MAQLVASAIVGEAPHQHDELVPLPCPPPIVEETRLLTVIRAGTTGSELWRDFPRALRTAGRSAWVFLVVAAINFLACGFSSEMEKLGALGTNPPPAQSKSLDYIGTKVDFFLDTHETMPHTDWSKFLRLKRTGYDGQLLLKGLPLTWRQMEPGLPAPGVAASVEAVDLAGPSLRPFLAEPWRSIKPQCEWPKELRRCAVRAEASEWQQILKGLHRRRALHFIGRGDLITWKGDPLLNGCFGVPKGDVLAEDFDVTTCVLRFIVNLQPSNDLQRCIRGDVDRLPLFTQWLLCQLLAHEAYLHSGDDQNSAFNVYKLPSVWLPWFVPAEPAWTSTLEELGVDVDKPWGAIGVLPMGWLSATGIMQHLSSRLTAQARLAAGVHHDLPEHSRGGPAALSATPSLFGITPTPSWTTIRRPRWLTPAP